MKFDLTQIKKLKLTDIPSWPSHYQILIFLFSFALLFIFAYFLFISSSFVSLNRSRTEELFLKQQLETAHTMVAKLPLYQEQNIQLSNLLDKIMLSTSKRINTNELLEKISTLASQQGVSIRDIQPLSESQRSIFTIVPIRINAFGGYHQIAKFLTDLLYSQNLVTIDELTLSQTTPNKGEKGQDSAANPLLITTTINAYWFTQQKSKQEPEKVKQPAKASK